MTASDKCPRCQGFVMPTWDFDTSSFIDGVKCLNCGWAGPTQPGSPERKKYGANRYDKPVRVA